MQHHIGLALHCDTFPGCMPYRWMIHLFFAKPARAMLGADPRTVLVMARPCEPSANVTNHHKAQNYTAYESLNEDPDKLGHGTALTSRLDCPQFAKILDRALRSSDPLELGDKVDSITSSDTIDVECVLVPDSEN